MTPLRRCSSRSDGDRAPRKARRPAKALPWGKVVAADTEPEMVRHLHHKAVSDEHERTRRRDHPVKLALLRGQPGGLCRDREDPFLPGIQP
jgi:hypothetical protein